MPLIYQHNINDTAKLGVWHIAEPESFFLQKVPVKRDVSHPHKRLQHLAGRYLLTVLFDDFPLEEILIADTRKPFLEKERYHFSISHCGNYAAAIVSATERVGVDIELIGPKIAGVKHKFLSGVEWGLAAGGGQEFANEYSDDFRLLTLLWSSKEAVFKWYGNGQVDFKKQVQLIGPLTAGTGEWVVLPFLFSKTLSKELAVHARLGEGLVLAWVMGNY
jgi:4'-phosphopantetheinyl transferase EntD